jgi:hypothetical protein
MLSIGQLGGGLNPGAGVEGGLSGLDVVGKASTGSRSEWPIEVSS